MKLSKDETLVAHYGNENKAFVWDSTHRDFGFAPRSFAAGAEAEIRSIGIPVPAGK